MIRRMSRPEKLDIPYPMSIQQIADEIGLSHQGVQQLIQRALRKLQAEMIRRGWSLDDVTIERGDSPSAQMETHGERR